MLMVSVANRVSMANAENTESEANTLKAAAVIRGGENAGSTS